jgi:uncharacterized membrane protein
MRNTIKSKRIWELDFFRGIALILMIYFHIIYDMKELFNYNVIYDRGVNFYLGKSSAILFILTAGISCNLSRNNVKRGIKVLATAMLITVVTHLYGSGLGIKFGILHFLGLCMLAYPLYGKLNKYTLLILGTLIILLSQITSGISVSNDYFFILGISSQEFTSSDYYPLVPWFGVFLYGGVISKFLNIRKESVFRFSIKENVISNMGRHTLSFYLVHQPAIVLALSLLNALFDQV